MTRINFRLVATVLMALLLGSSAFGQTSKGTVIGNITDPNGAVIQGANVTITNVSTGVSRETVSASDGSFHLEAVDPGTYNVEVSHSGFKTVISENVVVTAAQTTTTQFELEIGIQSEVVNVTSADDVVLQTQDGARVNTLSKREITDLPTPALNPTGIVFTLPGVVEPGPLAGGFVQGNEFSVNGLRARANNQLIDGLDNNDNSIAGQFYIPALRDGYSEVTVLQSDYSSEFGRAGGAVVNVVTRSGSNQFHGSVYDVINNSALNSLTASQRADGTRKPVAVENTFGFSLGGPIKKNKLFFFGTYQGDRFRSGTDARVRVPTASGFATLRSLFPVGTNQNLDRFLSIVGNLRGEREISSVALGSGRPDIDFGETTVNSTQPVNDNQFLARVDWTPTQNDSIAFRYVLDDQTFSNQFPGSSPFPGFEIDVPSHVQNFYANYTRSLSTRTTNEFRFGYGRFNVEFAPRDPQVGLAGPVFSFTGAGLGQGITSVGLPTGFPQGRLFNNYQFQDTLSHTTGNHTLRFGADLNFQRSTQDIPFNSRGILTFAGGGGFNSFGNFVDGFSGRGGGGAAIQFGSATIVPNAFHQNYFINDTWRVKENLTVNLGLRYENYGTPFNAIRFPAFAGFDQPVETVVRQERDNNNFAPRFSFAYQPRFFKGFFGQNKTVIRGGFAVNYDFFFNNILSNTAATVPNSFGATNFGVSLPADTDPRGIGKFGEDSLPTSGSPDPLATVNTIPRDLVNPQTYVYNFGIQREFPFNLIADVAYVGSRGTRLFINEELNPGIGGFDTLVRAFPNRGSVVARTNGGDSSYNSLQARLERGFKSGLLLRFAYTFSKAIDNVNSEVFVTTGGSSISSDPFDRSVDRSRASFDVPHRFVATFIYEVPSLVKSGLGHALLGGYSIGGIYRLQSGNVETPFVGGIDLNGDGNAFNDRPAISNPNAPQNSVGFSNFIAENFISGVTSRTGFSDVNGNPVNPGDVRFLVSESIRTSIAGRNILRGPRQNRVDLSLTKAIHTRLFGSETNKFEIRFDYFNALNTPQFAPGTGDVTDSTFNDFRFNSGNLNIGNVNAGRIGQFQVRYVF
ncbi:MAG TPA: carboxypeptidase regulatory-like domain-containing protein [Pyrinomonadaceae bacterium]|nr:carboxypeptidase regulatory-like domain-containing protein [Pyrinomonadaceae bacterium]